MSEVNVNGRQVCASHNYFQAEIEKIKLKLEILEEKKVNNIDWQGIVKDLQRDIAVFKQQLDEVIRDRHEDKDMINNAIKEYKKEIDGIKSLVNDIMAKHQEEIKEIKEIVYSSNISNTEIKTEIKTNQVDMLRRVDSLETKMDKIIEATTFNMMDWFGSFMNKNIITKLLTWFFGAIMVSLPISGFIYLWTGKNMVSLIMEIFAK